MRFGAFLSVTVRCGGGIRTPGAFYLYGSERFCKFEGMERRYIALSELLSGLKEMVAEAFPEAFWVKAEIQQYSPASTGHCYMTLSETQGGRRRSVP